MAIIMNWLRNPSNKYQTTLYGNISLLCIVGHGGMGKTTLLQHIYKDEMTKEFDLKMWVCVSNNFDVKKVIADMLESLKKERPHLETLETLQDSLRTEMMSKKFLLVLDDIWEEEEEERDKSKWENVLAPLAFGSFGSKILVTTRMNSIALMFAKVIKKKKEIFRLEGLEEDECLQLLNTHAFADVENSNDHKKLSAIAGEIVKKLSGSPLAAKVIGGVLNFNLDERHWMTVLESNFRTTKLGQNYIFSILRLSYTFLPNPLKSCFAFCCIFAQDHVFDKDDLIRMWIALGFIQPSHIQGETMEDIGGRYFDILVKKSFFDKFERQKYKMHDLLHELAQNIFASECFKVVDDEELPLVIPETIRHLSVQTKNLEVLRKIGKFKHLHSLFLSYTAIYARDNQDLGNILIEIFKASRSIRLLYLSDPLLEMIPEEIGYLIHLRYLKIDLINLTKMPRSLSNLLHMQFIIYCAPWFPGMLVADDFLPCDMNKLSNLHCLELPWNSSISLIHGIGKLNSLQNLNEFCLRNEIGYRIEELEHMNDLHKLKIKFLENVKDVNEARSAKLFDKRNLMDLSLEWGDIESRNLIDLDEIVLDNLQPPKCLKNLSIQGYTGARSPTWMKNVSLIHNIENISLKNCMKWQTLPPFGQLPFLKYLQLCDMPKVKQLLHKFYGNDKYCFFPSLEVLHINGLKALENWFDAGVAAEDECLFPCLTELELKDCPKLEELPSLAPKLKSLAVDNIGWKTLNCGCISNSIPLETLVVSRCPNITSLPLADEIARLVALRYLIIKDCPNLISLGGHQEVETIKNYQLKLTNLTINDPSILSMEPLRSFTSLEKLTIEENDELVSFSTEAEQWFVKVSSSLYELELKNLQSLQSLPSSLPSLSSLKSLLVHSVPQLQLLPNIPTSLQKLDIFGVESLQCLPSFLSTVSSLTCLSLGRISFLKSLPDLPPFLNKLTLFHLENLDCLPSCLPTLSSLQTLVIQNVPKLRELQDLPLSLRYLQLTSLDNLDHLPACLVSLPSLQALMILLLPKLRELPDLPSSLKDLLINNCHPELMQRYRMGEGSDWHKIAHIPGVNVSDLEPLDQLSSG
ncbi:hypothetical protein M5K25_000686 [Dendrobium thyrsiflorum]|uniref:Uncharacterized protein n=1 Tax=Dendrobium thyrsiflorum TaxID=117978 RepID=A0ABD0VUJ2_DENTH